MLIPEKLNGPVKLLRCLLVYQLDLYQSIQPVLTLTLTLDSLGENTGEENITKVNKIKSVEIKFV